MASSDSDSSKDRGKHVSRWGKHDDRYVYPRSWCCLPLWSIAFPVQLASNVFVFVPSFCASITGLQILFVDIKMMIVEKRDVAIEMSPIHGRRRRIRVPRTAIL